MPILSAVWDEKSEKMPIFAKKYKRDMDYKGLADHVPVVVEFGYEKVN